MVQESMSLYQQVKPYTMVGQAGVDFTVAETVRLINADVAGDLVECGVWKGGCSIAMLLAQRAAFGKILRHVHMLDSFEGLPQPARKDGAAALLWYRTNTMDNCRADEAEVHALLRQFDATDVTHVHRGRFAAGNAMTEIAGPIALLRIDCDWYDSVFACLVHLLPRVSHGGTVIIDDYYAWDGCVHAVHDYLSKVGLPWPLITIPNQCGAYFKVLW
jgi:O-methyltransferase